MKRFLLLLTIALACADLFAATAEAGRAGGASGRIELALAAAVLVMWLIVKLRKPQQPAMPCAAPVAYAGNIPPDFPVEYFLRRARFAFICLLAAKNSRNLSNIRDFTTPQICAEISMRLQESGDVPQQTKVIAISVELLQAVNVGDTVIASVRFTGQLRENNGAPEDVDEVWYWQKNLRDDKSRWLVAGFQQAALQQASYLAFP